MRRELVTGAMAGAVGIVALNGVSYLDMAVRGRPASQAPGRLVDKMVQVTGGVPPEDQDKWPNRRTAIGALLGYAVGLGTGALFGLVRSRCPGVSPVAAAAVVGAAAMAASDVPLVLFGLSDPRTWGVSGWASDIVPHLAYGAATVWTFDLAAGARRGSPAGPH
ncbi:MAG: hypothetical protein JWO67_2451 [Streptosporangiaceae bacterium]|jgi:hypothetical protein|nr:hypothetical protein [Streptosporangiaceae bacterium]